MSPETSNRRDRLESWKEIASYLERSSRTVRRWEREEKLPVHRHQHSKASTVFAFRTELDDWLVSRVAGGEGSEPVPGGPNEPALAPPPWQNSRLAVATIAAAALLLSSLALYKSVLGGTGENGWDAWVQRVPLHERLALEATYSRQSGDHAAALDSFKALLGLGEIDATLLERMLESCLSVRRPSACAEFAAEAADRDRPSQELQYQAARVLALWANDLGRAANYSERSRQLMEVGQIDLDPEAYQFVQLFDARASWIQGDLERSLLELERLEPAMGALSVARRDAVARAAGSHCLAMGRGHCAEAWFEHLSSARDRHEARAMALFARGDSSLGSHLDAGKEYQEPFSAVLLAMTKRLEVARQVALDLAARDELEGSALVAQGSVDLLSGNPEAGIEQLKRGIEQIEAVGAPMHFVGLDMLSMAAKKSGDLAAAMNWLGMTSELRAAAAFNGAGLFWIKCQQNLASLYTETGQVEEALRIERQLKAALALQSPS